ncbi:4-hydroxythreonine-4-phosphate dehydrogenase PdxA [Candidatus Saganbacteria bacterium]|nr:4-hydroxythreonine-4-phosphate dehydrogenase PdxA [Candidatus Saganbacteria bacterium]
MGDPAGIGPEIAAKAAAHPQVLKICRPLIIGDQKQDRKRFKLGQVSKEAGRASIEYVEKAIKLAMAKKVDAIVTGPISKEAIHLAGIKFPGHTELLAARTGAKNFAMMFISKKLWVILVTTHLPLSRVPRSITKKRVLEVIKLAHQAKPGTIGVAGLNPHAGEGGLFGREEIKQIAPAIKAARKLGIKAEGPISPDIIFNRAAAGAYGIVVAMYHDQGLIPLKLLSFGRSVNVTVGLPIIRTSVDHGTAFDIAGQNRADPGSMIEAVKAAVHFANARHA